MPIGKTRGVRIAKGALGRRPLLLAGLALCAAALTLAVARGGRRGDPGSRNASASDGPGDGPSEGRGVPGGAGPPKAGGEGAEASAPQGGIKARVRALIAEDPRTRNLPPVSIGVDDGMAWVEGSVPSPAAREALTDVVAGAEGINIVVNRAVVRRS